jgi:hypothetical protein
MALVTGDERDFAEIIERAAMVAARTDDFESWGVVSNNLWVLITADRPQRRRASRTRRPP